MDEISEKEINDWKKRIDEMSHIQMCELWRFAECGHPIFDSRYPIYNHFLEKYVFDAPRLISF